MSLQHLSVDNTLPLFSGVMFVLILAHFRRQNHLQEMNSDPSRAAGRGRSVWKAQGGLCVQIIRRPSRPAISCEISELLWLY